jgi:hypothetical protein
MPDGSARAAGFWSGSVWIGTGLLGILLAARLGPSGESRREEHTKGDPAAPGNDEDHHEHDEVADHACGSSEEAGWAKASSSPRASRIDSRPPGVACAGSRRIRPSEARRTIA